MNKHLVKRLGMNGFENILIFDKPETVHDFDGLVFDTTGAKAPYDFIFSFIFSYGDMGNSIEEVHQKQLVVDGGRLYLAYPKAAFAFDTAKGTFFRDTSFKAMEIFEMEGNYNVIGFWKESLL